MTIKWPFAPAELDTMLLLQQQLVAEPSLVLPGRAGFAYLRGANFRLLSSAPDASIKREGHAQAYRPEDLAYLQGEVHTLWRFLLSFELARHRRREDAAQTMCAAWEGSGEDEARVRQVIDAFTGPQTFRFLSRTVSLGSVSYYAFARLLHMTGGNWSELHRQHVVHSLIQLARARLRQEYEEDAHLWPATDDQRRAQALLCGLDSTAPGFVSSLLERIDDMVHHCEDAVSTRGSPMVVARNLNAGPGGQMAVV